VRGPSFCLSALALAGALLVGCTAESHENAPRPPVVPVVSISISDDEIDVAPGALGIPGQRAINLNQNEAAPSGQADPAAPLVANFRFSNLTDRDARLFLQGPVDRIVMMPANAPGDFTVGLKTGIYLLSSPASRGTHRLLVGPSRPTSAGDLLTP
jgi:hypothetical protein